MAIASKSYIEEWRRMLDQRIPDALVWYKTKVNAGTATANDHAKAAANCAQWQADITAALTATAKLAAFQARFADWTTANIQAVQTALAAIETAVDNYVAASSPGAGAAATGGATPLEALQAALAARIA